MAKSINLQMYIYHRKIRLSYSNNAFIFGTNNDALSAAMPKL